jgi:16S rRNA (uracil1498-N3)-methyltransferase
MTRRRFFAPPDAFAPDGASLKLAPDEARHLLDVLRLERGEKVFVFDGEGREFRCVIEERGGRGGATLSVASQVEAARPESSLRLTLALALLKGEKFDLVVQKATELGVWRIRPVVTKLADVRLRDTADAERRAARWRRIALEACKQSGRARVPEVDAPLACASLFEQASPDTEEWRVMFSERGGSGFVETIENLQNPLAVTALVGSEGGWTDEEIALAESAGWRVVTLGGRTLRAETAAITITALLQHRFGDLV